jgi:drug/metabolite transporter (DMT)-like permease
VKEENKHYLSKKQILAVLGLLIATIIWGSGFVVVKNAVEDVSPLYLTAWRFTIAALGMLIFFFPEIKHIQKSDLRPGIVVGFWLFLSYLTQTYGIKYTTASNNAFITAFYVIWTPFLNPIFNRMYRAPFRGKHLLAAFMAIAGIGLLSLDAAFKIRLGDGLTFLCSFCFAVHMMMLGRYAPKRNPVILTWLQMIMCMGLSWGAALIFEGPPPWKGLPASFAAELLYLGVFSTMVCFLLQTLGQKYLRPVVISILLSMECVFGATFSIIFLDDPFTIRIFAGFVLMFCAVLISVVMNSKDASG